MVAALGVCLGLAAPAAAVPSVAVKAVSEPPAELKPGSQFSVKVKVKRRGRGLRNGRLAYYLSPASTIDAGAVRLAGRASLRPLRRSRQVTVKTRVGVPPTIGAGSYFTVVCVAAVRPRGNGSRKLPCRASVKQTTLPEQSEDEADDEDPTRIAIFPWVTSGGLDDNWEEGLGFIALGLLGALVMAYFFLGEFLPSMGGKAEYDEGKLELEDLRRQHSAQVAVRERFVRGEAKVSDEQVAAASALTEDLEVAIARVERKLGRERWRLVSIGMPIYLVLGGAFAVLFASNALQAFFIGFGWTALADRFGLNKELAVKTAKREEAIASLRKDAQAGLQAQAEKAAAEARARKLSRSAEKLALALREETNARAAKESELADARKRLAEAGPPHEAHEGDEDKGSGGTA